MEAFSQQRFGVRLEWGLICRSHTDMMAGKPVVDIAMNH